MARLRSALGSLRRVLVVQRQAFDRAVELMRSLPGLEQDLTQYYRDVGDHLWQAIDEVDTSRDSLQGLLDTYTNEVQERLTIVATIFLPLTVITGFFGQNFGWMINDIGSGWAFWGFGVGGMVVTCLAIVLWLIRSGLYHGPRRS
jgi:magnesium transporter